MLRRFSSPLSVDNNVHWIFVLPSVTLGVPSRMTSFAGQKTISRALVTRASIGSNAEPNFDQAEGDHHTYRPQRPNEPFLFVRCPNYRWLERETSNCRDEGSIPRDPNWSKAEAFDEAESMQRKEVRRVLLRRRASLGHRRDTSIGRWLDDWLVQFSRPEERFVGVIEREQAM